MPRIAILDTYYPVALDGILQTVPDLSRMSYQNLRDHILKASFGTSDFVSSSLRALGWEAEDLIVNCEVLQKAWCRERNSNYIGTVQTAEAQISALNPDVVFMQDLSFFPVPILDRLVNDGRLLIAQCSCPWPGDDRIRRFRSIFTSFPHYLEPMKRLGVRGEFLKLAFFPDVASRAGISDDMARPFPVSFVGGFGQHWKKTPGMFEFLSREVGEFRWWGYGTDHLSSWSSLRKAHQGEAWGLEMYRVYGRSKIVINRHGEVAQDCGNNLRQYEATGMGALLLTDCVGKTGDMTENFTPGIEVVVYSDEHDLVNKVKKYLSSEKELGEVSKAGQARTLRDHTYGVRGFRIDEVLREELAR